LGALCQRSSALRHTQLVRRYSRATCAPWITNLATDYAINLPEECKRDNSVPSNLPYSNENLSLPTGRSYCRTGRKFFLFRFGDRIAGPVKRSNIHTKAFRPLSWMYSRSTTSINVVYLIPQLFLLYSRRYLPHREFNSYQFRSRQVSLHLDLCEDASAAVAHVMCIIMMQKNDKWPGTWRLMDAGCPGLPN
jgi:hypothetical protein